MKRNIFIVFSFIILMVSLIVKILYYINIDNILYLYDAKKTEEKMLMDIEAITNQIEKTGAILQNLKLAPYVTSQTMDKVEKGKIVKQLASWQAKMDGVENMVLALEDGQIYKSDGSVVEFSGNESEEWYVKTKRLNEITVVSKEKKNGNYCTMLSVPIIDSSNIFIGVLSAELTQEFYNAIPISTRRSVSQALLRSRDNKIVHNYNKVFDNNAPGYKIVTYIVQGRKKFSSMYTSLYHHTYVKVATIIDKQYRGTYIFSLIFILIIVYACLKVIRNKQKINMGKIVILVAGISLIECLFVARFCQDSYRKQLQARVDSIDFYKNVAVEACRGISENIASNFEEGIANVEKTGIPVNLQNPQLYALCNANAVSLKERIVNLMNIFVIDENGRYYSFPEIEDEEAMSYNFRANRDVKNSEDMSMQDIYSRDDFDQYVYVKKLIINGKKVGIIGFNMKLEKIENVARKFFMKSKGGTTFLYKDGEITRYPGKEFNNNNKEDIKLEITKDIQKELDASETKLGVVKYKSRMFLYYKIYGDDGIVFMNLDNTENNKLNKIIVNTFGILIFFMLIGVYITFMLSKYEEIYINVDQDIYKDLEKLKSKEQTGKVDRVNNDSIVRKLKIFNKHKAKKNKDLDDDDFSSNIDEVINKAQVTTKPLNDSLLEVSDNKKALKDKEESVIDDKKREEILLNITVIDENGKENNQDVNILKNKDSIIEEDNKLDDTQDDTQNEKINKKQKDNKKQEVKANNLTSSQNKSTISYDFEYNFIGNDEKEDKE